MATPTIYHDNLKTTLKSSINSTDTSGIVLKTPKDNNGANRTITSGVAYLRFYRGNKQEIVLATLTQSGDDITLSSVTRDVNPDDDSDDTTRGQGQRWSAGTNVEAVVTAKHMEGFSKKDVAESHTALKTFTAGINVSGKYIQFPVFADDTARDASITSPSNGMICYNTADGVFNQYISGAWADMATGSTPNMTTTVAGKGELGAVADTIAQTGNGSSGAPVVVPTSICVTDSGDGTWVEGGVPVLNSSKFVDVSLLGSGTADATTFLRGDGTFAETATGATKLYSQTGVVSVGTSSTTEATMATGTVSSFLAGGYVYIAGTVQFRATGGGTLRIKLGGNECATVAIPTSTTASGMFSGVIKVLTLGASGTASGTLKFCKSDYTSGVVDDSLGGGVPPSLETTTVDTTGSLDVTVTYQSTSSSANDHFSTADLQMIHFK